MVQNIFVGIMAAIAAAAGIWAFVMETDFFSRNKDKDEKQKNAEKNADKK